jgi:hypothetical protein
MQITILIEPIKGGRFRARSGEPLPLSAEADSREEAVRHLEQLLVDRLHNGAELRAVNVPSGEPTPPPLPFPADNLYETDWVFREMQEAIAENRRLEDEAERRRLEDAVEQ